MNKISFKEALLFWLKLGFISFGGPAGQISIMHEYLVEKRKWISESKFLHALNYCMLLPGPEALQLTIYTGWLMHRTKGGIAAGLLFILPSVFILLALSILYVTYGKTDILTAIFYGMKPAVVAIVFLALLKIGERALQGRIDYVIAILSLCALLLFNIPYPVLILAVILFGIIYVRFFSEQKNDSQSTSPTSSEDESAYMRNKDSVIGHGSFSLTRFTVQALCFLIIWSIPLIAFYLFTSDFPFWKQLSLFFTKVGLVAFGGAYSSLMYVSQFAVEKLHWLTKLQMVDGLALGETTPGPLMMVLSFVGFLGAYHHFNGSLMLGTLGLLAATFFTFLPSFIFILLGAPIVEMTQENKSIKQVLSFVTPAVVGVIANLTIFTASAVLFPVAISLSGFNWLGLIWIIISVAAMKKFGVNMILWIAVSALMGVAVKMVVGV